MTRKDFINSIAPDVIRQTTEIEREQIILRLIRSFNIYDEKKIFFKWYYDMIKRDGESILYDIKLYNSDALESFLDYNFKSKYFYNYIIKNQGVIEGDERNRVIDFFFRKLLKGKSIRDVIVNYFQYNQKLASDFVDFIKQDRKDNKEYSVFTDELIKSILTESKIEKKKAKSKNTKDDDDFFISILPLILYLFISLIIVIILS